MKLFKKTILYTVREDAQGNFQDSSPCTDCLRVIKQLNIKKMVFSSKNNEVEIHKPNNYNTNHISHGNRHLLQKNKKICYECTKK